jgi:methionyl-tRNA formyltransferase
MRIVFMGTPAFAVCTLKALLQSPHEVVGVVTQPDRPTGRGQKVAPPPVKQLALREGIPILQPLTMKDPALLEALAGWKPTAIVVAAFGRLLPKVMLGLPSKGCINVHASLLPRYRGASPIQWAIIRGERETGVTTMLMDEGMDTGPILLQERVPIAPEDTASTLSAKLAVAGGRLLVETLTRLENGTVVPQPQNHALATIAPPLKKEDGLLDWSLSAVELANRVRGLQPWPSAYTYLGDKRLIIWAATVHDQPVSAAPPGTIVAVEKAGLLVSTGSGILRITALQPANSRRMSVAEYLAGHHLSPGLCLGLPPSP